MAVRAAIAAVVFSGVAATAALGQVVVLPGNSYATHISADGRVVSGVNVPAGTDGDYFMWSAEAGYRQAGMEFWQNTTFGAPQLSGDGHYISAYAHDPAGRSFILSDTGGITYIPSPSPQLRYSTVGGISHDGTAAAGCSYTIPATVQVGWRWTAAGGLQTLPMNDIRCISGDGNTVIGSTGADQSLIWHNGFTSTLTTVPGSTFPGTFAYRTNYDASIIVGYSGTHAARWINGQGSLLPFIAGSGVAHATDVTEDGQVILGRTNGGGALDRIFIWTPSRGSELLSTYLASWGVDLSGYTIGNASVNATGNVFAVTAAPPGSTLTQTLVITIPAPGAWLGLVSLFVLGARRARAT